MQMEMDKTCMECKYSEWDKEKKEYVCKNEDSRFYATDIEWHDQTCDKWEW